MNVTVYQCGNCGNYFAINHESVKCPACESMESEEIGQAEALSLINAFLTICNPSASTLAHSVTLACNATKEHAISE